MDVTYIGNSIDLRMDPSRFDINTKDSDAIMEVPMILSNSQSAGNSDMSIYDYMRISENGDILKSESFRKRLKWYSHG